MRTLLLFSVLLFLFSVTAAQQPLHHQIWLNESKIPVKVNAISMDRNGLMWLGTESGIYTYDGREMVPLAGHAPEYVTAVLCRDSCVLYGTQKGAVYSVQHENVRLLYKAAATVSCICPLPSGNVIGTLGDGAYYISGQQVRHFAGPASLPDDYVYSVAFRDLRFHIATDLGIFTGTADRHGKLKMTPAGFPADIARKTAAVPGRSGLLWAGFQENGTGFYQSPGAHGMIAARLFKDWQWGQVNDILPVDENRAWVATENGALILVDISMPDTIQKIVLTGKSINALAKDRSGNLWLATNEGITMMTGAYLQSVSLGAAFHLPLLTAMSAGKEVVWLGEGRQLYCYNGKDQQRVLTLPDMITCLYADKAERLWIGTPGSGLFCRQPDGRLDAFTALKALNRSHILSVAIQGDQLWVASLNGVDELQLAADGPPVFVKHHNKRDGIGSDYVYKIITDSRHRLWFATDGAGIAMYDGQTWHHWGAESGFASKVVYAVCEDAHGYIWAATLGDGLLCYNGRSWQQYRRNEGLQDETVFSLAADRSGRVFAVTGKGIDVWYDADREFRHFNNRGGVVTDSTTDLLNAAVSDSAGNVYIPYLHGLLLFPRLTAPQSIRPAVIIDKVSLLLDSTIVHKQNLAADENYLTFHYRGIGFSGNRALYFRYRLEGLSASWIETGDASVTFPRLLSGRYRFVVQASLNKAFLHPSTAAYSFTIATPVWKRWWFISLLLLATGTVCWLLFRWRLRSIRQVARLEQERLSFEYDYLKSQVNPHFLFNSLNTLISLIEEDPAAAVNYTVELSDLYRDALSKHEGGLILLEDEWGVLNRYFYIQKNRFGQALQLDAVLPERIRKSGKIVPLALQILTENALKHNVVSSADPLIIHIRYEAGMLIVSNRIRLKATPERSSGLGLQNIIRRYALVTQQPVVIEQTPAYFTVKLPLL